MNRFFSLLASIIILAMSAICVIILPYFIFLSIQVFRTDYEIDEMDWDNDGSVTFTEFISSTQVGVKNTHANGKLCKEYFSYKDGLPIKNSCE